MNKASPIRVARVRAGFTLAVLCGALKKAGVAPMSVTLLHEYETGLRKVPADVRAAIRRIVK